MQLNVILAVTAAVLAIPCWLTLSAERTEDFVDTEAIPKLFPGFSADLVTVIEIKRRRPAHVIKNQNLKPEQSYEGMLLQRDGDRWVLLNDGDFKGLEMDAVAIRRDILDHVSDLRLDQDTLVPEERVTKLFRESNELTEETGISIRCLRGPQGPEVAKLVLGKSTSRGRDGEDAVKGYFVCDPSRPREVVIYEPQSEYWVVSVNPSDWAKKQIHSFLLSEVESFYYANSQGSAGFKRESPTSLKWVAVPEQCRQGSRPLNLEKLGMIKQEDVSAFIDGYRSLTAEGFVRRKIATDTVGAEIELRARLKDGTDYVVHIGPQEGDSVQGRKAVSSGHDFQFWVSSHFTSKFRRMDSREFFHPR